MSEPLIIYVPGIKPKPPAAEHRAMLWRCLLEGVRRADPEVAADLAHHPSCFTLVSWSHLFYDEKRDLAIDLPGIERVLSMPGPSGQDLREAHSWRRRLRRSLYLLCDAFPALFDLVGDPNMRVSLRDTRRYFADEEGAARQVRQMLADVLLEAWQTKRRVLLAGHSLGSVIAFDVLWDLSHHSSVPGEVDLFLSIGSPLGLRFVRKRLLGAGEAGRQRFPTRIRRWQNLSAVGEMTALDRSLAGTWAEMSELGLVEQISDRLDLQTYFRDADGLNVHRCYGYMVNPVLGATLARWWREQPAQVPDAALGAASRLEG